VCDSYKLPDSDTAWSVLSLSLIHAPGPAAAWIYVSGHLHQHLIGRITDMPPIPPT